MGTKRARDDTGPCVGEGRGQGEVSGQHAHDSRHRGVKRQSRALARTHREREVVKRKIDAEDGAEGGVSGASRKMSKNDSGELGVTRMSTTDDVMTYTTGMKEAKEGELRKPWEKGVQPPSY